jgi:hypothetical protein
MRGIIVKVKRTNPLPVILKKSEGASGRFRMTKVSGIAIRRHPEGAQATEGSRSANGERGALEERDSD